MNALTKTYQPKGKQINRNWHLMDAADKTVGRLASEIAKILQGKNKPDYSAHMDSGDYVVVLNSEKTIFTGKKEEQKIYFSHSLYPRGLKKVTASQLRVKDPSKILYNAILHMLPKNRLQSQRIKRLKLVIGDVNPYLSQINQNKNGN